MLSTCGGKKEAARAQYMSPVAYVRLVVCERVLHDGHRSIFVVVHAGPSQAEGLEGLNPPPLSILQISSPYLDQGEHIIPAH